MRSRGWLSRRLKWQRDCSRRIVDVPKSALSLLVISPGGNHSRDLCARYAPAFPPTARCIRISSRSPNTGKGNFQTALERPDFVRSEHFKDHQIGVENNPNHIYSAFSV